MKFVATVFVLTTLVSCAMGIFEDQAGQTDWHREHIGHVRLVAFSKLPSRYALVATESGVVASLNLKTGAAAWRKVLPEGEAVSQLLHAGQGLVTVTEDKKVSAWRTDDGMMLWDDALKAPKRTGAPTQALLVSDSSGTTDVAVLHDDRVAMHDVKNGQMQWTWTGTDGEELLRIAEVDDSAVYVIGRTTEGALSEHKLDTSNGKRVGAANVLSGKVSATAKVMVAGKTVVAVDVDKCAVVVHRLGGDAITSYTLGKDDLKGADCASEVIAEGIGNQFLVRTGTTTAKLFTVAEDLSLKLEHTYTGASAFAVAKDREGQTHIVSGSMTQSGLSLSLKSGSASIEDLPATTAIQQSLHGDISGLFLNVFSRKDGSVGSRVLVVSADFGIAHVQNGEASWRREEALASVTQVEFVGLPFAHADDVVSDGFLSELIGKLKGENRGLVSAASLHIADYSVPSTDKKPTLYSDKFQIRKLAIVLTAANKVYALNTDTSEIVWSHMYGETAQRLFLVRNTAGSHAPECVVVLGDSSSPTTLVAFNPLDGEEVNRQNLGVTAAHVVPLPDKDPEYRTILMVIAGSTHEVFTYPATPAGAAVLKKRAKNVYWHNVDKASNTLTGYKVLAQGEKFVSEQTWEIVIPPTEAIDQVAARPLETVFSPNHITGTHDVLRKYLNPNILAISTVSDNTPFFKGTKGVGASGSSPSVHMYCIDTVTGHVLYHVAHPQSMGPTHLALSENWVAHTYWSDRHLRTEMSVLELWEDEAVQDDLSELVMRGLGLAPASPSNKFTKRKHFSDGQNEGNTFSSFTSHAPQKEEQSFVFPLAVKALAVSSTEIGITSKDLLVATSTDQLFAMPRKFFDARRPMKDPTAEEMEEGLMKYHPLLPMIPTNVLSYNQTIARLQGIRAAPAGGLESTSLVLAYGLDMFFTRSAPSKTFDMLPEDFQYGILGLTIVGLTVATFAATVASKRKDLNMLWR